MTRLFVAMLFCTALAAQVKVPLSGPYSTDDVLAMLRAPGAKWTGEQFVPFVLGDNPTQFKPLVAGTPMLIQGKFVHQAKCNVPESCPSSVLLMLGTFEPGMTFFACPLTTGQLGELQPVLKEGPTIESLVIRGELSKLLGSSNVMISPCQVEVVTDWHGAVIYRRGKK